MKTFTISLVAAALVTGFATQAVAGPSQDETTVSKKVSFPELDLSKPQGAKTLLLRIHNAAAYVCASGREVGPVQSISPSYRRCVRDASTRAVAQVNNPMVTALYGGAVGTEIAAK
jgi:UrcA family protein